MNRSPVRIAATLLLAVGLVTCTDGPTTPSRRAGATRLSVVPSFTPAAQRALTALHNAAVAVRSVRIVLQRPPAQTIVDTTVSIAPGTDSVVIELSVQLQAPSEQLAADMQLLDNNGTLLFEGTSTITAVQGAASSSAPTSIPLSYVGPGSTATTLTIAPHDTTIVVGQGLQYTFAAADAHGTSVGTIPLAWSSSDISTVSVGSSTGAASGLKIGAVTVTATSPTGLSAAATLHVVNPPAKLQLVGGDGQSGVVGRAAPQPFVVQVLASDNSPLAGIGVAFRAVTAGASVGAASVITDAQGRASTSISLGSKPGSYSFEASVPSTTLPTVTATANASAGSAAALALVSGNGQTDSVSKALAQPLVVRATDSLGNVVQGATVNWTRVGGGSLSATSSSTDANGLSSVSYTLGSTAGTDTIKAQLAGVAGAGATVSFVATARPRGPSTAVIISGNGQSAVAGSALAQPLVVEVRDSQGNRVAGVSLDWSVKTGGGTPSVAQTTTDSTGRSSVTFTTGTKAGIDSVAAQVHGTSITAFFGETGTAGPAALMSKIAGDGQTAPVSTKVAVAPSVKLTDLNGNPIPGVVVTFSVSGGGGSVTGGTQTTDVLGVVTVGGWTLGASPGTNTLSVSGANIGTSFTATGAITSGRVASLTVTPHVDTLTSIGDTYTLSAQSHDSAGTAVMDTVTWVSRTPAAVTVNGGGVVTAVANGSSWIVASDASLRRDSALVTVQQRVATVTVTPSTRNIYLTRSYTFTAVAVDGRGHAMPGSPTFTWASNAPAVASVNSSGVATGAGLGSAQISATTGGVTGVATVNVLTPITRIVVGRDVSGAPVTDTTSLRALGYTRTFRALAYDTAGAAMTGITFTFTSTNASVAGLDSITATTARATAAANGITSITATAQGVTGNATLNVQQALVSVQLSPATATVAPNGNVALTARGLDANNRFIAGGTFKFASAATGVAVVDSNTGVVTGKAIGTANVTASSGSVISNASVITVSNSVPPKISFGRDTIGIGRGTTNSIPIFLSTPNGAPVTVNLAVRDTIAYFSPTSVTIPAGQTSINATLVGRNAGTTKIFASDGSSTGYAGDSSTLAVQATLHLTSSGYSLNATDQYATQVLLSDPSPAGGTYVTFSYGTSSIAAVSPDPAFIPAGQLAANIVIRGLAGGNTTITPSAIGVNGTASNVTIYAATLKFSRGQLQLGQGQYDAYTYVYLPTYNSTQVPLTITSSDTTSVTVTSPVTIPAGSYYAYFTTTGTGTGTATISVSSPGWTQGSNFTVTSTTPHVGVCCSNTLNTTSPTLNFTVYAEDSSRNVHYRVSSLVVHVSSSDTTVLKVLDTVVTIAPGSYYASGRVSPGTVGGTAWLKVSAGGHTSDSTMYTVVGPKLQFSRHVGILGVGQYDPSFYVQTPNYLTAPLKITISNSDSSKVAVNTPDSIGTGGYYVYLNARALARGSVTLIASAPGYRSDTATYFATIPQLSLSGGGQLNNFAPPQAFTVYSVDSTRNAHYRSTPLIVSFSSSDTTVLKVDAADTIQNGRYYANTARVTPVGPGTARIVASAAGHLSDSVSYTVVTPRIAFSSRSYRIGARQHRNPTDFYVQVPNNRTTDLAVTLTQKHGNVLGLTATSLTIPTGSYYAYFGISGLTQGTDTIVTAAAGYAPDTMIVVVTTPRLISNGIPGSGTTTNPPFAVTVYSEDSTGYAAHYASDTVVVHAVSSDTTVLKPEHRYFHIVPGAYYAQAVIDIVGPGTASLTFTDSATSGITYTSATTNSMTVTGPSLYMSSSSIVLGMRQTTSSSGFYVYTQNNVTAPLTVHLLSTSTRVASVPDSVTIPAGRNYAYFAINALDTIGTIQVQATASGYTAVATTVQVTQPKFLMSTNTTLRTTQGRAGITVYAADANGNSHYTTEDVIVTLASSATGVASIDSGSVTITAGSYYNNRATWGPGVVGTAQLSATDTRAAYYKYSTATSNVSVVTPSLHFNFGGSQYLGIGQYIDNEYVYTDDNQSSNVAVAFSHAGTAFTTTSPSTGVTIPAGSNYAYFRTIGNSSGTDTLVAAATSPQHNPARGITYVGLGAISPLQGWPSSMVHGDSVLITLYARDVEGSVHNVVAATTFTLSSNANIQFVSGGVPITSITIPADANQVTFYLKAVSAGTGSASITATNYQTYSNTVTVQ